MQETGRQAAYIRQGERRLELPGRYLIRDYVEDARAVIEATGNRPVVFIGMSKAGQLATNFAATYPHLVEKLVLVGANYAAPAVSLPPDHWLSRRRAAARAGDLERALRIMWEQAFTEPGSYNLIESFVQMNLALPREVIENFWMAEDVDPARELRPLLPTLRMPTLILHGEEDAMTPLERGRYLAEHIPGAQFYVFKGRCHHPAITAPTEFAQVVREFISTGRVL